MSTKKSKAKKSRRQPRKNEPAIRALRVVTTKGDVAVVPIPEPTTDVITEKTYITTEPEVEIRKPATLAQALTEPALTVIRPKSRVRKEVVARTRRKA